MNEVKRNSLSSGGLGEKRHLGRREGIKDINGGKYRQRGKEEENKKRAE